MHCPDGGFEAGQGFLQLPLYCRRPGHELLMVENTTKSLERPSNLRGSVTPVTGKCCRLTWHAEQSV